MTNLLLASASPRRRQLLALLHLPFEVAVANVVEVPRTDETPAELVIRLCRAKAHAIVTHFDVIVIACDTVVALDGEILGKPRDATEAISMLRRLCGRCHTVYSGVTLLEPATGRALTNVIGTRVAMRAYTDAEIAAYVASGDPLDKAGAYAVQHPGFHPVVALQGCYANVVGLPLCYLTCCLRAWGVEPPCDVHAACQSHTGHNCTIYPPVDCDMLSPQACIPVGTCFCVENPPKSAGGRVVTDK
ncbi:MAG: Maf family protein [Chloroflexota bacterium]|nr:Maf family protein [Chloroflexota bacterium]